MDMVDERDWVDEDGDEEAVPRPLVAEWKDVDMEVDVGWVGLLPLEVAAVAAMVSLEWEDEDEADGVVRGMVRMVSMKPWMRMLRWTWNGCSDDGGSTFPGTGDASGVWDSTRDGLGLRGDVGLAPLPLAVREPCFEGSWPFVDAAEGGSGAEIKVG